MLTILKEYQKIVNQILDDFFIKEINNEFLKEMSQYALSDGKRLRSALALNIYLSTLKSVNMLNNNKNLDAGKIVINELHPDIINLIISVELLHTTSLILDDLPSMDNDIYRRGQETVHYKYGKSNANVLIGYFLEQSFYYLGKSIDINNNDFEFMIPYINDFKKQFLKEMMIATEGQYLDINTNLIPSQNDDSYWQYYGDNHDINLNLIGMKTAPFFMIGFCGGYLIGRIHYCIHTINTNNLSNNEGVVIMDRSKERFNIIRKLIYNFSYGFQISDDILDMEIDKKDDIEFNVNYALNVGIKKAKKTMFKSLNIWKKTMEHMSLWTSLMEEIYHYIPNRKK